MSQSSEPAITLYDVPSSLTPQAWNPSAWKARLVLNYKRIPYKTVWVSFLDVESTLKKVGGVPASTAPDDPSIPLYTIPAIIDTSTSSTNPTVVVDSLAIAEYLDAKYPERPVLPRGHRAFEYIFEDYYTTTIFAKLPLILLPLSWDVLDERGKPYFRETRERWIGKKLEEFSPEGPTRDAHWDAIEKGYNALASVMEKNGLDVEFIAGGSEPTRADFLVLSSLAWIKAVAPEEGWNKRVRHWNNGRWEKLWNRSEEWRSVH